MNFDEFQNKLEKILYQYSLRTGKVMTTIDELKKEIDRNLVKKKNTGLKSLKGIL